MFFQIGIQCFGVGVDVDMGVGVGVGLSVVLGVGLGMGVGVGGCGCGHGRGHASCYTVVVAAAPVLLLKNYIIQLTWALEDAALQLIMLLECMLCHQSTQRQWYGLQHKS